MWVLMLTLTDVIRSSNNLVQILEVRKDLKGMHIAKDLLHFFMGYHFKRQEFAFPSMKIRAIKNLFKIGATLKRKNLLQEEANSFL